MEKKIAKVVESLILPKYPQIYDYEIKQIANVRSDDYDGWVVNFFIDSNENWDMYKSADISGKFHDIARQILNLRIYQLGAFVHVVPKGNEEELPFDEDIKEGYRERTFSEKLDESDLKWHWDEQDRLVSPTHKTDWMFQFDDELPISLKEGEEIFIEAGRYHRVIKGSGDLKVKVKFL